MSENKLRLNDEGKQIPDKCPKCGSDIGIFLKGEPVFLCKNQDCNSYFGTVPFNETSNLSEGMIDILDESSFLYKTSAFILGSTSGAIPQYINVKKLIKLTVKKAKTRQEAISELKKLKTKVKSAHTWRMKNGNIIPVVDKWYKRKIYDAAEKNIDEKIEELENSKSFSEAYENIINESEEMYYGLPKQKKYPMPDAKHVKSAIRFFNYVEEGSNEEKQLANAIFNRAKELKMTGLKIGPENRLRKFIDPSESEFQPTFLDESIDEGFKKDYAFKDAITNNANSLVQTETDLEIDERLDEDSTIIKELNPNQYKQITPENVSEDDAKPEAMNGVKEDLVNDKIIKIKLDKLPTNLFITSDIHLFRDECKEETFNNIISNINKQIKADDTLLILGDVGYKRDPGLYEHTKMLIENIKCKHLWLALGNHDLLSIDEYYELGFEKVAHRFDYEYKGKKISFTHYPINGVDISVHGHIHLESKDDYRGNIDFNKNIFINVYFYSNHGEIYTFKQYMKDNTLNESSIFNNVDENLRKKQIKAAREKYKKLINEYDFKHLKKGLSIVFFDIDEDRYIMGDIYKFQFLKWDLSRYTIRRDKGFTESDEYKVRVEGKLVQLADKLSEELRCKVEWDSFGSTYSYLYIYAPEGFHESANMLDEKLETLITRPFLPKMVTLYHGSPLKLDIIEPKTVNIGTKVSQPRMSSFWTTNFEGAMQFAVGDVLSKKVYKKYKNKIDCLYFFDLDSGKVLVRSDYKDEVEKILKTSETYVYEVTIDSKYVGRGHNRELDEYTIDIPIKPDKMHIIKGNKFKQYIEYVDASEVEYMNNNRKEFYKKYDRSSMTDKIIYHDKEKTLNLRKEYRKLREDTERLKESSIAGLAANPGGPCMIDNKPDLSLLSDFDYTLPTDGFLYDEMTHLINQDKLNTYAESIFNVFNEGKNLLSSDGDREYNVDLWLEKDKDILFITGFTDESRIAELTKQYNCFMRSLDSLKKEMIEKEKIEFKKNDYYIFYYNLFNFIQERYRGQRMIIYGTGVVFFDSKLLRTEPVIIRERGLAGYVLDCVRFDHDLNIIHKIVSYNQSKKLIENFKKNMDKYNIYSDLKVALKHIKSGYLLYTADEVTKLADNTKEKYICRTDLSCQKIFFSYKSLMKFVESHKEYTYFSLIAMDFFDEELDTNQKIDENYRSININSEVDALTKKTKTQIKKLREVNSYLSEASFNIDAEGTVIINMREKTDFMAKYNMSHKLIKIYKKAKNIEGLKHEICKLWFMYIVIEQYYVNPRYPSRNKKFLELQEEAIKAKAFILNEFYQTLEFILEHEKDFDFSKYFENSPYYKDSIRITTDNVKGVKKMLQAILN